MSLKMVYIIIVNYGTPEHTIECLESVQNNDYTNFQALIVDYSDINQSIQKLSRWMNVKNDGRFTVLQEKYNRGFSYANNVGINYALEKGDCDFFWILNNDTIIEKNSLTELLSCYSVNSETKNLGFIGSKIMDYENRELIQNVGGKFNKWTAYSVLIGLGTRDKSQFQNKSIEVDYIVGASMFCHRSVIEKVGFMPENYFLYYEDIDWCISASKVGFENISCTKSVIYHKQGVSTGAKLLMDDSHLENKQYLYISLLELYRRHFRMLIPIAYSILFKQMAGKIFHGKYAEAKLIWKVIVNDEEN